MSAPAQSPALERARAILAARKAGAAFASTTSSSRPALALAASRVARPAAAAAPAASAESPRGGGAARPVSAALAASREKLSQYGEPAAAAAAPSPVRSQPQPVPSRDVDDDNDDDNRSAIGAGEAAMPWDELLKARRKEKQLAEEKKRRAQQKRDAYASAGITLNDKDMQDDDEDEEEDGSEAGSENRNERVDAVLGDDFDPTNDEEKEEEEEEKASATKSGWGQALWSKDYRQRVMHAHQEADHEELFLFSDKGPFPFHPTDKTVIEVCYTGLRALQTACFVAWTLTAARAIAAPCPPRAAGFDSVGQGYDVYRCNPSTSVMLVSRVASLMWFAFFFSTLMYSIRMMRRAHSAVDAELGVRVNRLQAQLMDFATRTAAQRHSKMLYWPVVHSAGGITVFLVSIYFAIFPSQEMWLLVTNIDKDICVRNGLAIEEGGSARAMRRTLANATLHALGSPERATITCFKGGFKWFVWPQLDNDSKWLIIILNLTVFSMLILLPIIAWLHFTAYENYMLDAEEKLHICFVDLHSNRSARSSAKLENRKTNSGVPSKNPQQKTYAVMVEKKRLSIKTIDSLVRAQEKEIVKQTPYLKYVGSAQIVLEVMMGLDFLLMSGHVFDDDVAHWTKRDVGDVSEFGHPLYTIGMLIVYWLGYRLCRSNQHSASLPTLALYNGWHTYHGTLNTTVLKYISQKGAIALHSHIEQENRVIRTQTFKPFLFQIFYTLLMATPWVLWLVFYRWDKPENIMEFAVLTSLYFFSFLNWSACNVAYSYFSFQTYHHMLLLDFTIEMKFAHGRERANRLDQKTRHHIWRRTLHAWNHYVKKAKERRKDKKHRPERRFTQQFTDSVAAKQQKDLQQSQQQMMPMQQMGAYGMQPQQGAYGMQPQQGGTGWPQPRYSAGTSMGQPRTMAGLGQSGPGPSANWMQATSSAQSYARP